MKKLLLFLAIVVFLAGTALGEEGSYVNDAAHQEKMFWQIVDGKDPTQVTAYKWGGVEEAPFGYFVKVPRTGRYVFVTVESCPNPNQVTAYKASDGRLFEKKEELEKYKDFLQDKLLKMLRVKSGLGVCYGDVISAAIVEHWPEILAIMQDPAEKQTGLTPEKKKAFIEFYYKCLENSGETVFTIMFDNWSGFQAIMEGEK